MLIKPGSKRRRTQADFAMEKDAAELQKKVHKENEEAIEDLQRQLEEMKQEVLDNREAKTVFEDMLNAGIIHKNEDDVFELTQQVQVVPEEQM